MVLNSNISEQLKRLAQGNTLVLIFALGIFLKLIALTHIITLDGSIGIFSLITINLISTAIVFAPAFFTPKNKFVVALVIDIILTVIILTDLYYFRFFNSIPSLAILTAVGKTGGALPEAKNLFHLADILFLADFPIGLTLHAYKRNEPLVKIHKPLSFAFKASVLGFLFVLFSLSIYPARAKGQTGSLSDVANNKVLVERYGILAVHGMDLIHDISEKVITISESEKNNIVTAAKTIQFKPEKNTETGIAKGKNIIFVQEESLMNFVIGKKIDGQEITPNLNKLVQSSHYFNNHYFEIGSGGTSDVDFSVNTSLYPLANDSAFINYGQRDYSSLEKELKKAGYSTAAYHANNRGFWDRDVAFSSLGFDKFYAKEDFPDGTKVQMGLNDEEFLQKTAEYIKNQPKPSFSYAITLSNHYPFGIPDNLKTLNIKNGKIPKSDQNYLESVNYTDQALGKFIEKLKNEGLYDDSVFVVYGDHYAKIDDFSLDGFNYKNSNIDAKNVPLMIKLPNQTSGITHSEVSSHLDIMPTILNLIDTDSSAPMFGRDLFSNTTPFFAALHYFDPITVYNGAFRYRLLSAGQSSCEVKMESGYTNTDPTKCRDFANKAKEAQILSEKLIKYNLFRYF